MTLARLVAAILTFLAAGSPAFAQSSGVDTVRATIEKAGVAFADAFNRGDFAAVAAMYAADGFALPPDGDIVRGRPAIEALWKGAHDSGLKRLRFTVVDVQLSGDLAVEVGTAALEVQPAGQPAAEQMAKYVVVWKRGGDGVWQLFRDIWNSLPAPK